MESDGLATYSVCRIGPLRGNAWGSMVRTAFNGKTLCTSSAHFVNTASGRSHCLQLSQICEYVGFERLQGNSSVKVAVQIHHIISNRGLAATKTREARDSDRTRKPPTVL